MLFIYRFGLGNEKISFIFSQGDLNPETTTRIPSINCMLNVRQS